MAHVCEDDGDATTFVAPQARATHAPVAVPAQWALAGRKLAVDGQRKPLLERAERSIADGLKTAA